MLGPIVYEVKLIGAYTIYRYICNNDRPESDASLRSPPLSINSGMHGLNNGANVAKNGNNDARDDSGDKQERSLREIPVFPEWFVAMLPDRLLLKPESSSQS